MGALTLALLLMAAPAQGHAPPLDRIRERRTDLPQSRPERPAPPRRPRDRRGEAWTGLRYYMPFTEAETGPSPVEGGWPRARAEEGRVERGCRGGAEGAACGAGDRFTARPR